MLEITVCSFFLSWVQNMKFGEGISQVRSHACIHRLGSFPKRLCMFVSAALLFFVGSLCRLSFPHSWWVLPVMIAGSPSTGHISLSHNGVKLLLQGSTCLRLLWRSYLGGMTWGWVAGNNNTFLWSVVLILFLSSSF